MKITNSIQFGEGNFIRAFVDYCIQLLNEQTKFKGKIHLSLGMTKIDEIDQIVEFFIIF